MKNRFLAAAAALATILFSGAASASSITPVYADCDPTVTNWNGAGVACSATGHTDASAVNLGAGDGQYYSLGLPTTGITGVAVFEITPAFQGLLTIVEVTAAGSQDYEAADVFVALADGSGNFDGGTSMYVGTVDNGMGGNVAANDTVTFTGTWDFIYIQDASLVLYPNSGSTDGFDLDSIRIGAVPLPAGGLLLISALVGLGWSRRRRAV